MSHIFTKNADKRESDAGKAIAPEAEPDPLAQEENRLLHAIKLRPNSDSLHALADVYREQQKFEQEKAALLQAHALAPRNINTLSRLAYFYVVEGDFEKSQEFVTTMQQVAPHSPKTNRAISHLNELEILNEKLEPFRVDPAYKKAQKAFEDGDLKTAHEICLSSLQTSCDLRQPYDKNTAALYIICASSESKTPQNDRMLFLLSLDDEKYRELRARAASLRKSAGTNSLRQTLPDKGIAPKAAADTPLASLRS